MLQNVSRDLITLTERAGDQLERFILEYTLGPGDRLPSEKRMGEMLGVSRTVVREAVRLMVAKGLVETRTGSGTYIRKMGAEMIRDPMNLLLRTRTLTAVQIIEVRQLLEAEIADLAARRANHEDIEGIEETVQALSERDLSARDLAEVDVAFHNRLAVATDNPLFEALSESMSAVLNEICLHAYTHNIGRSIERAVFYHSRILQQVRAGDPKGARQAMKDHLADSRDWMQEYVGSEESANPPSPIAECEE